MISNTVKEFQNIVLNRMTFTPEIRGTYTLYRNKNRPELGYFIKYERKGYYDFGIGDYTIPNDFKIDFEHNEEMIRFGTVYQGETKFIIENNSVSSFTPSSFFVVEKEIKGTQVWNKGQHLHGAEITIYKKYFDEIIKVNFPEIIDFNKFIDNYTYKYLPIDIIKIIQDLRKLAESQKLNLIYLESKILESIALIYSEISSSPNNAFSNQLDYGKIKIGKDRYISLTASDIGAIKKAHDILSENISNPPTIRSLSKIVFLNEQKLKAGFILIYHMSINEYTISMRMAMAETLLSTTELTIEEIAKKVGYNYSSNFSKMFKKIHGKTPLAFRNNKE